MLLSVACGQIFYAPRVLAPASTYTYYRPFPSVLAPAAPVAAAPAVPVGPPVPAYAAPIAPVVAAAPAVPAYAPAYYGKK
ncbi:unnamed protein product, partial [Mesorhabditis belari]|uniref:Uncharacterized protein n=1 Tax=Mesorhabditis belari TaxID=2138241 RepID=A0AAF3EMM8_9BILA